MILPNNLINLYDGIGWIPSIKGLLSLDLLDDANNIFGDIDKYSIRFEKRDGFDVEKYIIASSLHTVNSSRLGKEYVKSFRYIFTGSINSKEIYKSFLEQNGLENKKTSKKVINSNSFLIGHLVIMPQKSHLSELEVTLLKRLKDLTNTKEVYLRNKYIDSESIGHFENIRLQMLMKWREFNILVSQIENDQTNELPTFCFEIVLTQEGIILLKDKTNNEYKNYYSVAGTVEDYTKNIYIPNLFVSAWIFVKSLFHSDQYHQGHMLCSLLSNLHYVRESRKKNYDDVFMHQLSSLFFIVEKQKKTNYKTYLLKPEGIIVYIKSFINVFKSSGLVDNNLITTAMERCNCLEKDIELTNTIKPISNNIFSKLNENPHVLIQLSLQIVQVCLGVATFLVANNPQISGFLTNVFFNGKLLLSIFAVILIIFLFYDTKKISFSLKNFDRKPNKKSLFFIDSNLEKARLSYLYIYYNYMKDIKILFGKKYYVIQLFFLLIILFFLIYLITKLIYF